MFGKCQVGTNPAMWFVQSGILRSDHFLGIPPSLEASSRNGRHFDRPVSLPSDLLASTLAD